MFVCTQIYSMYVYIYNICTTKWWYSFLHIFQATFWTVQRFNPIHVIYTPFGVFVLKRIDSLLNQGCWEPYTYHSGMIYTPHLLTGDLFFRFMAFFVNPKIQMIPIIILSFNHHFPMIFPTQRWPRTDNCIAQKKNPRACSRRSLICCIKVPLELRRVFCGSLHGRFFSMG